MAVPTDLGAAEGSTPSSAVSSPDLAASSSTPWIVLATAGTTDSDEQPISLRRVVASIAIAAVVIAVIVAVAGALVSRQIAEKQAVHDVAQLTDLLAEGMVQPALTDAAATDPAEATHALSPLLPRGLAGGSIVRIKLWSPSGQVLYSDEPRLIGQTFPLAEDARSVFTNPHTQAEISDLQRPENSLERGQGKLLEVYRPVWTPSGSPLLFETYFKYDTVTDRSHELWRGFGGIMISSLAALVLLMLPLGWLLFTHLRRTRAQREELMRRALEASEVERKRIAASLHDGVVQQLVAASFTAAGQAEQATAAGEAERAASLQVVAATIRDGLAGLRSLLVEIYPASLGSSGLAAALSDLARATSAGEAVTEADIDEAAANRLAPQAQAAVFRVAQEALRNATRHSGASCVRLTLSAEDEQWALLEVEDDGRGFDTAAQAAADNGTHFGVRLMTDAARSVGAGLAIWSDPGEGTYVRMLVRSQ